MLSVITQMMMDIHYSNNNMVVKNVVEQLDMDMYVKVFEKGNCSLLKEIVS
jgi:hypothetical protein